MYGYLSFSQADDDDYSMTSILQCTVDFIFTYYLIKILEIYIIIIFSLKKINQNNFWVLNVFSISKLIYIIYYKFLDHICIRTSLVSYNVKKNFIM